MTTITQVSQGIKDAFAVRKSTRSYNGWIRETTKAFVHQVRNENTQRIEAEVQEVLPLLGRIYLAAQKKKPEISFVSGDEIIERCVRESLKNIQQDAASIQHKLQGSSPDESIRKSYQKLVNQHKVLLVFVRKVPQLKKDFGAVTNELRTLKGKIAPKPTCCGKAQNYLKKLVIGSAGGALASFLMGYPRDSWQTLALTTLGAVASVKLDGTRLLKNNSMLIGQRFGIGAASGALTSFIMGFSRDSWQALFLEAAGAFINIKLGSMLAQNNQSIASRASPALPRAQGGTATVRTPTTTPSAPPRPVTEPVASARPRKVVTGTMVGPGHRGSVETRAANLLGSFCYYNYDSEMTVGRIDAAQIEAEVIEEIIKLESGTNIERSQRDFLEYLNTLSNSTTSENPNGVVILNPQKTKAISIGLDKKDVSTLVVVLFDPSTSSCFYFNTLQDAASKACELMQGSTTCLFRKASYDPTDIITQCSIPRDAQVKVGKKIKDVKFQMISLVKENELRDESRIPYTRADICELFKKACKFFRNEHTRAHLSLKALLKVFLKNTVSIPDNEEDALNQFADIFTRDSYWRDNNFNDQEVRIRKFRALVEPANQISPEDLRDHLPLSGSAHDDDDPHFAPGPNDFPPDVGGRDWGRSGIDWDRIIDWGGRGVSDDEPSEPSDDDSDDEYDPLYGASRRYSPHLYAANIRELEGRQAHRARLARIESIAAQARQAHRDQLEQVNRQIDDIFNSFESSFFSWGRSFGS